MIHLKKSLANRIFQASKSCDRVDTEPELNTSVTMILPFSKALMVLVLS